MNHDPEGHITVEPNCRHICIRSGDTLIADTRNALELRETGYPTRQYIPRADVAMRYLQRSKMITHCPFKGDATYYSVNIDGTTIKDAAWSYEEPIEAMEKIRGHIAFASPRLQETAGE
ncbi:MAG: DUF427 domain-containing protein [Gammaproteobacteria bacterium]